MDAADQLPDFGIRPGGDGASVQNRHLAGRNLLHLLEARFEQLLLDRSTGRHAAAHFKHTGHPEMKSVEPGQDWSWRYIDKAYL